MKVTSFLGVGKQKLSTKWFKRSAIKTSLVETVKFKKSVNTQHIPNQVERVHTNKK